MKYNYKLSRAEKEDICRRYEAGESSIALGIAFQVAPGNIIGIIKRRGIRRRNRSEAKRFYRLAHHFFDEIDSEATAYWLGFLAADGHIGSGNSIRLGLASKDREHVVAFQQAIGSTHPVVDCQYRSSYGSNPQTYLYLRSQIMAQALRRHGFTAQKTTDCPWPPMPEGLRHHFVRGYVDGDGGFYVRLLRRYADGTPRPNGQYVFQFMVTSHVTFIETLQQWLMAACQVSLTKLAYRKKGRPFPTLMYAGRRVVQRIYACLYEKATIWLSRKRVAIEQGLQEAITPRYASKLTAIQAREIRERYHAGGITNAQLAAEYGVAKSTIVWITTGKHWRVTAS